MGQVRQLLGFRELTLTQRQILRDLVDETVKAGSITWGAHQAQGWGVDKQGRPWTFDTTRLVADAAYIALHKTLPGAARARWNELSHTRMTTARVITHLDPLNPHRDTVLPMAEEGGGIPIWVPDDFVPNGTTSEGIPSLSAQTHAVGGALRRMVNDGFHQKHLCFILSTVDALFHNPHISPSQWAAKAGHEKGRNCNNCSWGSLFHPALNSDALREWARDRWGPIQHPTIEDFVRMIEKFASDAVARGEGSKMIRIWKMDIAGAYTQLTYRAEDVHLMACALPGDLVAFFTCGTFGWGAMPFAFNVITKAIVWELNEGTKYKLNGRCLMYVDDLAGVCFDDDMASDQDKAKTLIEGLLGDGAIATDKTEPDDDGHLDFIGYNVDIRNKRVGISRRNTLKALWATLEVEDGSAVTTKQMQRVASHGSRYKRVCQLMAPFTHILYRCIASHPYNHVVFSLTDEELTAVAMLKVLLMLTTVEQMQFTRSFESFTLKERQAEWTIEYDASLTGIAIIWYKRDKEGNEVAVGCYATSLEAMQLTDNGSGRMNTAEFIAGTIGIRGLAQRGVGHVAVRVRGDNVAAMTWAEKSSFKSDFATRAAVVHVAQRIHSSIEVVDKEHLPHTKEYDWNWRCDLRTRDKEMTWAKIVEADTRDPKGSRLDDRMEEWDVEGAEEILELCNPNRAGGVDAEFVAEVLRVVGPVNGGEGMEEGG